MRDGEREAISRDSKYTLLTGATGLVGQYLLKDLLESGERVAVLVRPQRSHSAAARVDSILAEWETRLGRDLPRPVVLSGCITNRDCGLTASGLAWVRQHVRRIVHNAAVLTFEGPDRSREPWLTNVGGTQNILNVARDVSIRDFFYVSTAYVCGEQSGVILEDQLDVGQRFRNDYERSKFEAEKLVRDCGWIQRPTVFRPAVISGDSQTGFTTSYHGLYLYLRLIALLVPRVQPDAQGVRHTPIRLPMRGNERRNVVPVDWVSRVIVRLLNRPEARGRTFHLAPDTPITPRQVVEYCYQYFGSEGVIYCEDEPAPDVPLSAFEAEFLQNVRLYRSYDQGDPIFDRTHLNRIAGDLICPAITPSVLHRYLDFGQRDRWGKRRKRVLVSPWDGHQVLTAILEHSDRLTKCWDELFEAQGSHPQTPRRVIGFDLLGPGGGQWQLVESSPGTWTLAPGLPAACAVPTIRLPLTQLIAALAPDRSPDISDEPSPIPDVPMGAWLRSLAQELGHLSQFDVEPSAARADSISVGPRS